MQIPDLQRPSVQFDHATSLKVALRPQLLVSQHYLSFLSWFNFERAVDDLVAQHIYFLDLDPLLDVIRRVCHIKEEKEVTAMLNFYHDLRLIVKHGRTVVLQAQWLIDLFKQLITVRPQDETVSVLTHAFLFIAFFRMTFSSI